MSPKPKYRPNERLAVRYINELCGRGAVKPSDLLWVFNNVIRYSIEIRKGESYSVRFHELTDRLTQKLGIKPEIERQALRELRHTWRIAPKREVSLVLEWDGISIGLLDRECL